MAAWLSMSPPPMMRPHRPMKHGTRAIAFFDDLNGCKLKGFDPFEPTTRFLLRRARPGPAVRTIRQAATVNTPSGLEAPRTKPLRSCGTAPSR